MKLRNKETGEIENLIEIVNIDDKLFARFEALSSGITYKKEIHSILDLGNEWEDYKDERQYTISDDGEVVPYAVDYINEETDKGRKSIGNCFRTREEAEKAVEKLKAWKRLKDSGFEFKGWKVLDHDSSRIYFNVYRKNSDDIVPFLDLLFGGEE